MANNQTDASLNSFVVTYANSQTSSTALKPYRSSIMRTFGATVEGSPSMSTRAGKNIITRDPHHQSRTQTYRGST